MATAKVPLKVNYTSGNATSMGEFEDGDVVPVEHGGTGADNEEDAATALGVPRLAGSNLFTGSNRPGYSNSAAISTTSSFAFDPATHEQVCLITLTNAITVTFGAPTNIVEGATYKLILKAGDTSARTFAWNSAYKFPAATPTITAGSQVSGAYDVLTFIGGPSNTLIMDGADVR